MSRCAQRQSCGHAIFRDAPEGYLAVDVSRGRQRAAIRHCHRNDGACLAAIQHDDAPQWARAGAHRPCALRLLCLGRWLRVMGWRRRWWRGYWSAGVVDTTTLRVAQRLVGHVERLHQVETFIPGDIRMVAPRQPPIGQPDSHIVRVRREFQNRVIIYFFGHGKRYVLRDPEIGVVAQSLAYLRLSAAVCCRPIDAPSQHVAERAHMAWRCDQDGAT